jgi:predicted dehydrogenase
VARLGIILHGVTGRMGYNQHLVRSILAIRDQGGLTLKSGDRLDPDPIIVGRNADKMEELAKSIIKRWSTDLDAALANPDDRSSSMPARRRCAPNCFLKAIAAGKHVYCEKPISDDAAGRCRLRERRAPPA